MSTVSLHNYWNDFNDPLKTASAYQIPRKKSGFNANHLLANGKYFLAILNKDVKKTLKKHCCNWNLTIFATAEFVFKFL